MRIRIPSIEVTAVCLYTHTTHCNKDLFINDVIILGGGRGKPNDDMHYINNYSVCSKFNVIGGGGFAYLVNQ